MRSNILTSIPVNAFSHTTSGEGLVESHSVHIHTHMHVASTSRLDCEQVCVAHFESRGDKLPTLSAARLYIMTIVSSLFTVVVLCQKIKIMNFLDKSHEGTSTLQWTCLIISLSTCTKRKLYLLHLRKIFIQRFLLSRYQQLSVFSLTSWPITVIADIIILHSMSSNTFVQ